MTRATDHCQAQRHTSGRNTLFITDPSCRIQVQMGGRFVSFPAMFVLSAGPWMPAAGAYRGHVSLSITGSNFAFSARGLHPRDALKPVEIFIASVPASSDVAAPDILVRDGEHRESDLRAAVTFPVRPDPHSDKFGLLALRANQGGELYTGRSSDGRAIFFDCSADHPRMEPMCRRRYHRHGLAVHYWFAKKYLADWQLFDRGVTTLLDQP